MVALVDDVVRGTVRPRTDGAAAASSPTPSSGSAILLFERGPISITVRADDPALPPSSGGRDSARVV